MTTAKQRSLKQWSRVGLAMMLAACAGESRPGSADSAVASAAAPAGQPLVRDAWVRPADSGAMSAAYFVLHGGRD